MELILKEDVKNLGFKNDVVNVKPGYGRNYLIPQGIAVLATPSNIKVMNENLKQAAHKASKLLKDATELAEAIGDMVMEIKAKAGETGRIFGAVTSLQVSDALKAKGFEVDRKRITIPNDVKSLGEYEATIILHKQVTHKVKFVVIAE
ncbi:MAG TPA: 50S ribosomal protein L9 [Catalimonadaceae bacterium]|nr:50S ribosomal protein L9 [Catalimonadaceae bacterium]